MTMAKFGFLLSGSGLVITALSLFFPEFGERTVNKEDIDKVESVFNFMSSIEHKE